MKKNELLEKLEYIARTEFFNKSDWKIINRIVILVAQRLHLPSDILEFTPSLAQALNAYFTDDVDLISLIRIPETIPLEKKIISELISNSTWRCSGSMKCNISISKTTAERIHKIWHSFPFTNEKCFVSLLIHLAYALSQVDQPMLVDKSISTSSYFAEQPVTSYKHTSDTNSVFCQTEIYEENDDSTQNLVRIINELIDDVDDTVDKSLQTVRSSLTPARSHIQQNSLSQTLRSLEKDVRRRIDSLNELVLSLDPKISSLNLSLMETVQRLEMCENKLLKFRTNTNDDDDYDSFAVNLNTIATQITMIDERLKGYLDNIEKNNLTVIEKVLRELVNLLPSDICSNNENDSKNSSRIEPMVTDQVNGFLSQDFTLFNLKNYYDETEAIYNALMNEFEEFYSNAKDRETVALEMTILFLKRIYEFTTSTQNSFGNTLSVVCAIKDFVDITNLETTILANNIINDLYQNVEQHKQENNALKRNIKELQQQLQREKERTAELQSSLLIEKKQNEIAATENDQSIHLLTERLEKANREIEKYENKKDDEDIEKQLDTESSALILELEEKISAFDTENKKLLISIEEERNLRKESSLIIEKLSAEKTILQTQNDNKAAELWDARDQHHQLLVKLQKQKDQYMALRLKYRKLINQSEKQRVALSRTKENYFKLIDEKMSKKLSRITNRKNQVDSNTDTASSKNKTSHARLKRKKPMANCKSLISKESVVDFLQTINNEDHIDKITLSEAQNTLDNLWNAVRFRKNELEEYNLQKNEVKGNEINLTELSEQSFSEDYYKDTDTETDNVGSAKCTWKKVFQFLAKGDELQVDDIVIDTFFQEQSNKLRKKSRAKKTRVE